MTIDFASFIKWIQLYNNVTLYVVLSWNIINIFIHTSLFDLDVIHVYNLRMCICILDVVYMKC